MLDDNKNCDLAKYGQIISNEDPNIYVCHEKLWFYKSDKDRAVKIAQKRLKKFSDKKRDLLEQLLLSIFNLWKLEFGIPKTKPVNNDSQYSGFFLDIYKVEDYDADERLDLIEKLKPWETSYNSNSPLKLLSHLYSTGFENISIDHYFNNCAIAILISEKEGNKNFWPDMINIGFLLAEIMRPIFIGRDYAPDCYSNKN